MRLKCYVIHDSKVGAFMQPWFARSAGEALRSWEALVNDGQSMMSSHPADFSLFEVAEYDEATGRFDQYEAIKSLGTALESKRQPSPELPLAPPPVGKPSPVAASSARRLS